MISQSQVHFAINVHTLFTQAPKQDTFPSPAWEAPRGTREERRHGQSGAAGQLCQELQRTSGLALLDLDLNSSEVPPPTGNSLACSDGETGKESVWQQGDKAVTQDFLVPALTFGGKLEAMCCEAAGAGSCNGDYGTVLISTVRI